jgi:hypothetical protein
MNNDMTLMQLAHYNVHFFITAIVYHTQFNFTKSKSASGISSRSTIARRRTSGSRSTSRSAINSDGAREEVESQVAQVPSSPRTPTSHFK